MNEPHNPLSDKQKVNHLILLVGGNPLPNAVAGRILLKPGGTIGLLYSRDTIEVKNRLKEWFGLPASQIAEKQIDESNPTSIYQGTQELLATARQGDTIGLNYTGGTKAMSVHAYQATKDWASEKKPRPSFTYLDARTLSMVFDASVPQNNQQPMPVRVGLSCELKLKDLLSLHGWTLNKGSSLTTTAILPQSAHALISVVRSPDSNQVWREWIKVLENHARKSSGNDWKNEDLRKAPLAWPDLTESEMAHFVTTFCQETSQPITTHCNFATPKDNGIFKKIQYVPEWLHGKWLEHYVLDVINHLPTTLYIHECLQNIETSEVQFDVDVIVLRGYQLFAFSCSTSTNKSLLKSKLFEAYIRARQIGGDEARVALVCCHQDPQKLEMEMRQEIDTHVSVFGINDLLDLGGKIARWITEESGER